MPHRAEPIGGYFRFTTRTVRFQCISQFTTTEIEGAPKPRNIKRKRRKAYVEESRRASQKGVGTPDSCRPPSRGSRQTSRRRAPRKGGAPRSHREGPRGSRYE